MKTIKKLLATTTVIVSLISANEVMAVKPKPFNRIVAIIDASGTFRNHQFEAIQKVQGLMDRIAETKDHRYQAPDEVYLITLDSKPEVVWYGDKYQLEQLSEERLSALFGARRAYSNCTEIAKAFNLAAQKLNREPSPAAKYIFSFTDLSDEPTVAGESGCKAPARPSLPPDDINWDKLSDTSINVFWAPDGQIEAWESALADLGLHLTISFYNEAEAQNVEPPVPAKARFKMTEEERAEKIDKIKSFGAGVGVFGISVLALMAAIFGGLIYFRNRTGRGAASRNSNSRNTQNLNNNPNRTGR